jgi:hypothetical protein
MLRHLCLPLMLCSTLCAAETTIFDGTGRVDHMIYDGEELAVHAGLATPIRGWLKTVGQGRSTDTRRTSSDGAQQWSGSFEVVDSGRVHFEQAANPEGAATRIHLSVSVDQALELEGVYYAIELPRAAFLNGRVRVGTQETALGETKPARRDLTSAETGGFVFADASSSKSLTVTLDRPRTVLIRDEWNASGRHWVAYVELLRGSPEGAAKIEAKLTMALTGTAVHDPAKVTVDPSHRLYRFDGFGGNYCFGKDSPAASYTLDNLKVAWARVEMSLKDWEPENDNESATDTDWAYLESHDKPGTKLHSEFLLAQEIQKRGIPYVISIWWLPEWMYGDPGRGDMVQNRRVGLTRWDEVMESVGSYLLYAKRKYGVEPDLFSFNESNIGIYVLISADEHRYLLRSLGAHLRKLGLKTKMLLADATGPQGTHVFALPAAADLEALQYVGAVAFHSWGGASPEQYQAWGDVARWLNLPLLVTELGVDPFAWRGRLYDSYDYGLREVRMYQEILAYARPQATLQWEFTDDYSLVHVSRNGQTPPKPDPTSRFWLVKHFTNLTPPHAEVVESTSNHPEVLVSAFAGGPASSPAYAIHIANLGPEREVTVSGLPGGLNSLQAVETTESTWFADLPQVPVNAGKLTLLVPARSLLTLTSQAR